MKADTTEKATRPDQHHTGLAISAIIPSLEGTAAWLRCPRCSLDLAATGELTLGCLNGHRFDANKRGYLNTVDSSRGILGDPRPILEARAAFLALGHYEPIAELIASGLPDTAPLSIVDSGCGTGYYLQSALDARPGATALALDVSAAAVAISVAATGASGVVADVWRPLPIRTGIADAVLCVFAPRNSAEFARVLSPGGRLLVITPRQNHLMELRDAGQVIGIQADKVDALDATLATDFTLLSRVRREYTRELDVAARTLVATMGPTGHHELERVTAGGQVTIAVDLSVYTAR